MELMRTITRTALLLAISFSLLFSAFSNATGLRYIETASGSRINDTLEVIRWTHARLVFDKEIERIAVGQTDILEVELLGGKEALMLAKKIGKTSMIVWYTDGTTEPLVFGVIEDLAVLRGVLQDIHKNIRIELAPDRAALILRGTVPTIDLKVKAEIAAKSYLSSDGGGTSEIYTPDTQTTVIPTPRTAIINLIKTDEVAATTEEKLLDALTPISEDVTVKRVMKSGVADDSKDTFILEGEVPDQVALTRILNIASSIIVGNEGATISVVSDESGGIAGGVGNLSSNIARAKMLSIDNGRILSLIRVRNIPQVRVAVQIHEVNRKLLKDWSPNISAITDRYQVGALGGVPNPNNRDFASGDGEDVANALQVLNGTFTNNFQVATSDLAFDLLFSLLEEEGISRTLSNPSLTVLSGEPAVFEVGGEVPVPTSFTPSGSAANDALAGGTYSNVDFKSYGITLDVLPMVGENNEITLEVKPEISRPDIDLTRLITSATGSSSETTAFSTRSLETSTHVRDGQPLIIGGLLSSSNNNTETYTPGISQVPILGWGFNASGKKDDTTELVIIVTPTVVQQPIDEVALWQYPSLQALLEGAVGIPDPESLPEGMRPQRDNEE